MVSFSRNGILSMYNPPTIAMSFLLFLFFQILFTIRVSSYNPVENFAVNCGASGEPTASLDNRNWTGDIGSKLFFLVEPNNGQPSVTATATGSTKIPYDTARLSRSEFTYSFPVTDGQKFIRLYFFPFSYLDFLRSDSLFTVKAGSHTLLKDFNASLTADYDDDGEEETVLREYCVNVEPGQRRLDVTFTPITSHLNAYAFVNGIEVVSMPTYLYYTSPDNLEAMQLNGLNQQFPVKNSSALQTAYRVNVGANQVPPENDTGMFRNWEVDARYLEMVRPQSISAGFGLKLDYKNGENYTAPDQVYLTARNYGMKETSEYNVTWEFKIDSGFTYMVRLHFCEFDAKITSVGDRVFQIFIADTLVERHADVMVWTQGSLLVPVHRDYAVSMLSQGSLKTQNLSIKLRPVPFGRSSYHDVLLNGIEVLKISDSSDNLGGPNPDPRPSPSQPLTPSTKSSKNPKKTRVISIVVGVVSGFVVLSLVVLLIFRRLTRAPVNEETSWWGQKSTATSKTSKTSGSSSLPSDLCRRFSIAEIKEATNNFDDIFIVGVGGFGNVYKGYINNGMVPVAIKRLKQGSQQGVHEFQTEIEMLSKLRHLHLVSLIGYCNDGNESILVYEFMARGTLRDHLYDSDDQPLSWNQRLEMCLGAARGLHYLHTGANHSIIHRDVKTTNILIDEKWVAKISDFGLSKVGPTGMSRSHISTVVKGSVGYLDPEYYKRQRLTQKSDVYSFGVVLLEVLCGRPPLLRTAEKQRASLVDWVRRCHHDGLIHRTVDPFLIESITSECLKAFSEMALKCLVDDGNERPSMSDLVWGLEFALELQKRAEMGEGGTHIEGKSEESELLRKGTHFEENKVEFTSSEGTGSESTSTKVTTSSSGEQPLVSRMIFSELYHPTVR